MRLTGLRLFLAGAVALGCGTGDTEINGDSGVDSGVGCDDGYEPGEGDECVDVDECAVDNGGCGNEEIATCANTVGSFECECETDYLVVDGACASTWAHEVYVKASNTGAYDAFGRRVALSADGSRLAVTADREASDETGTGGSGANDNAAQSGAVYVFARNGSTWIEEAYIKAHNTDSEDWFGGSLALSGDGSRLAVGASQEDSNETGVGGSGTDNSATNSGAVYVFARSGSTWTQEAYVKASNTGAEDRFGASVALSGDASRLAVGANAEDSSVGAAYVFVRNGSAWTQEAYVKASNMGGADHFGLHVALSEDGSRLAVGAPEEDSDETGVGGSGTDNSATGSGAVYVFARVESAWSQEAYVKASNTEAGDSFGWALALSADGGSLVVGAYDEDSSETGVGGAGTDNSAERSGAAYVFMRDGTTWSQEAYVKASNADEYDQFGISVSLSSDGSRLAVGANAEDSSESGVGGLGADNSRTGAGATYLFVRADNAWRQEAYVKASNPGLTDSFGMAVALSADGTRLAVGAIHEDSNETGAGGSGYGNNGAPNSGAVYVYRKR